MTLFALPYWLEWRLVVILFVGIFLFVVWKEEGSLRIIPDSFITFFKKLYNMIFRHIEDEEAYEANKEQREADEAYKKELKSKKKSKKQ
jgi:hypothetical protein